MTDEIAIMYIAVIVAVTAMMLAAKPLANFIARNPTIVMLALGFLLMIGMTLIADGMGYHVPKGYIYAAMGFSALVEGLNMLARRRKSGARARQRRPTDRRRGAQTPSSTMMVGRRGSVFSDTVSERPSRNSTAKASPIMAGELADRRGVAVHRQHDRRIAAASVISRMWRATASCRRRSAP